MHKHYHELYGWLPKHIVDNLSPADKNYLFLEWLCRKPTKTGWFIAQVVVSNLGEPFAEYMFNCATEAIQHSGEELTKETLIGYITDLMEAFATDTNILYEFVETYRQETNTVLNFEFPINDEPVDKQEKSEFTRDSKGRLRDSKGHFVKE